MLVGIFTIHPFSSMSVSCYYSRSDTWEPDRSTTRNYLTAGTLDWPTAGTLLFAGDNLAGGKVLPLAPSISPAVTCRYPRRPSHICQRYLLPPAHAKNASNSEVYPWHMPCSPALCVYRIKKKLVTRTSTFTI
jgi:hypothetical protein